MMAERASKYWLLKMFIQNMMLVVVYASEKVFLMISLCIFLPCLLTKDKFLKERGIKMEWSCSNGYDKLICQWQLSIHRPGNTTTLTTCAKIILSIICTHREEREEGERERRSISISRLNPAVWMCCYLAISIPKCHWIPAKIKNTHTYACYKI